MFYSHQLLARKAPLGQIWMAATLHSKINRKRLDKLDIIKICEEILNPSVPMALRLSRFIMGGVVIVYERKVKLLYADASRFLTEINEAWRTKPATDPTVLPKGKAQAKYEAVTLPEKVNNIVVEQPMFFTETDGARFRGMRLEDVDEQYVNVNLDDDDFSHADRHHQAEAVNFESGLAETDVFNRFERFDIADDETTVDISPDENPQVPSMLVPSPPRQEDPPQQEEQYYAAPSPVHEEPQQGGPEEQEEQRRKQQQPPKASKRKARRELPQVIMDSNQMMIPGNIYQTWLKDATSLVSKRRRVSSNFNFVRSTKISDLMDIPAVALISHDNSSSELYYPKPLMQLWKDCTEVKSTKVSSGGQPSSSQEQQPKNSPPQAAGEYEMETGGLPMDFTDGIEKLRANMSTEYDRAYNTLHSDHSVTPGSPGLSRRSASSSGGSGRAFIPLDPEIKLPSGSGRSKRGQHSSARSLGNLDTVEEEFPLEQEVMDFKMRRLSDYAPTPDLLEETEPTQTPYERHSNPMDKVTETIMSHLKLHFDSPGAPQSESLSHLAHGMTKAKAARLFYQTTAEAVNITLVDNFESGLAETDVFNRFERFDIADDETTVNISPDENPQVPSMLVPSPPRQEDPPQQEEQYYAAPSPVHEEPQHGVPKGWMKAWIKCALFFLCCMAMLGTVRAGNHCDDIELSNLMGFCTAETPNGVCCNTVLNIIERNLNTSCLCDVLNDGIKSEQITKYYYLCNGKFQAIETLINQCTGTPPPPPPPPPPPEVSRKDAPPPPAAQTPKSKPKWPVVAITILSCAILVLLVWLIHILIKKHRATVSPFQPVSSVEMRGTRLYIAPGNEQIMPSSTNAQEVFYDAEESIEAPEENRGKTSAKWMGGILVFIFPCWGQQVMRKAEKGLKMVV